ncbi:MAG: ABC transporter substrate-binding protein [Rhodospirillaceae bacterium]|nr:ABC transporter substrate-binding protein [Rhodospirillaceae bacterium]MBT6085662.1 ABC transporter substrate-binding protein [Rhodospirillaceae bacterium]MBT6884020.1 ABC transporter substrate-binding protein [Rhodospirillaceae bacterium]MBT7248322.1 ABC transporter substrate-binding protein [Rhodospirillaceae bacterium]
MTKKTKITDLKPDTPKGQTRRSFLQTAMAGGAAATTAYLGLTQGLFAKESGPIVIGHQCELTGGFSSWGYWHDKCAKAAVKLINDGGGISGRKVELAIADTESNPAAGARKLRSLIQRKKASFIVGSVHSGIMLASLPIATELKTPYFSAGEATEATGSKGSRYSFRTGTDTYALAAAGVPWAMENLGKNWTMIFPDYAWGHSHHQEHRKLIEAAGGKVNDPIAVPLGTKDLVPYLARIPEETEVLFSVFFGALSVAFYTQQKSMRLDEKMKMYSVSGTIEAIDPRDIGGATEGVYFLENFPRPLEFKNDDPHKKFIELMDVDPVYAKENGSKRVMAKSHAWQSYENLFVLKAAIEASGWQSKKDTQGAIEALEGLQMKNSLSHPQGTKVLRAEDHSGMIDCYMSRVEDSKFVLKKRIPREELMAKLPPRYDFRKYKL